MGYPRFLWTTIHLPHHPHMEEFLLHTSSKSTLLQPKANPLDPSLYALVKNPSSQPFKSMPLHSTDILPPSVLQNGEGPCSRPGYWIQQDWGFFPETGYSVQSVTNICQLQFK